MEELTLNQARNPRGPIERPQEVRQVDPKEGVPAARKEEEFCKAIWLGYLTMGTNRPCSSCEK
jgi:hypothetical protein